VKNIIAKKSGVILKKKEPARTELILSNRKAGVALGTEGAVAAADLNNHPGGQVDAGAVLSVVGLLQIA
jgi:hypothetical protein